MITSKELLAAARAAQGIVSNYRLARELDVPEKTVQRWNTCKNAPDDPVAVRLAEMAGLDPAYVLASMYAQRSAEGPLQRVWATIAQRAQAAAAVMAAVIVSVVAALASPDAAHAGPLVGASPATGGVRGSVSYVKWLAALLRRLAAHLAALPRRPARGHRHPLLGVCVTA